MPETKRRDERVKAALPVRVAGGQPGLTRDVSASGVFFETDEEMSSGNAIEFTVEFDGPAGPMVMRCSGEIVRVERSGGKVGVAAKILESKLELKGEMTAKEEGAAGQGGLAQAMEISR
jgi:hypothetical protein